MFLIAQSADSFIVGLFRCRHRGSSLTSESWALHQALNQNRASGSGFGGGGGGLHFGCIAIACFLLQASGLAIVWVTAKMVSLIRRSFNLHTRGKAGGGAASTRELRSDDKMARFFPRHFRANSTLLSNP